MVSRTARASRSSPRRSWRCGKSGPDLPSPLLGPSRDRGGGGGRNPRPTPSDQVSPCANCPGDCSTKAHVLSRSERSGTRREATARARHSGATAKARAQRHPSRSDDLPQAVPVMVSRTARCAQWAERESSGSPGTSSPATAARCDRTGEKRPATWRPSTQCAACANPTCPGSSEKHSPSAPPRRCRSSVDTRLARPEAVVDWQVLSTGSDYLRGPSGPSEFPQPVPEHAGDMANGRNGSIPCAAARGVSATRTRASACASRAGSPSAGCGRADGLWCFGIEGTAAKPQTRKASQSTPVPQEARRGSQSGPGPKARLGAPAERARW